MKRFTDHLRGLALGITITLCACGYLYLQTHTIKFTATASNQSQAEQTAALIERSLPPMPEKKPAVK